LFEDEYGSFDPRTHLSRLLNQVAAADPFTVTKHGTPVAKRVPIDAAQRAAKPDVGATIARQHQLSKGVRLGNIRLRDLIEESRKS
jgi:prevent-host-death family protein